MVLQVFQDIPKNHMNHKSKNKSEACESYEPLVSIQVLNHANILTNMMIDQGDQTLQADPSLVEFPTEEDLQLTPSPCISPQV